VNTNLSDEQALRLRYLELTPADRDGLADLAKGLMPHLNDVLETWHGFLCTHPSTAPLLANPHGRGHLRGAQRAHVLSLLTGTMDAAYFAERARVGRVHHRIGLAPFWYVGAYRKLVALVQDALRQSGHSVDTVARWSVVLQKVVTLDLALALDAYQEQEQAALLRSNQELELQVQQAQAAARLKEEFLSHISHELRTPLHAMLGFSDLVADGIQGPVTADQAKSLAKVRVNGERLVAMVDQMIEAAKLSATRKPEPVAFDPTPLLEEVAATARAAAAQRNLSFLCELATPLPQVLGNRRDTAVALRQLLDNAVVHTAVGTVVLSAAPAGASLRIEVRDSGPGIPAQETERIFEPFQRGSGADEAGRGGLGMGLTLARETIGHNGGTLVLEKTGVEGSTFVVELPLAQCPEA